MSGAAIGGQTSIARALTARAILFCCGLSLDAALEAGAAARLLCNVLGQRTFTNRTVAGIAVAATTGALVGVGRRSGSAALPFAAVGAVLTHELPRAGSTTMVVTGLVLHLVAIFIWSAIFVRLAEHVFARDWLAAVVVALAQMIVSWFVAWTTGTGMASVIPLGDRLVFAVVMAIALVAGMRFARSSSQNA